MKTINKLGEPPVLTSWKKLNPGKCYKDLSDSLRRSIRDKALKEQFYLCAYCCQRIRDIDACHNEHVEAQAVNPRRTLDFLNIVASCNAYRQCGSAHGSQRLHLTPLMNECEHELKFKISGRVEGLTGRALAAIRVLNLGDSVRSNRSLVQKRKQLTASLLFQHGVDPSVGLEDEELLEMLIVDLLTPNENTLESYAPVVVNILRSWL